MTQIGLTRAGILSPIASYLQAIGAPVEGLLVKSGLPAWILTDPEALVPTSSAQRLLNQAARIEGIDNIGLLAGEAASIETLGVFGHLVRRSATLGEALNAVVRNHALFSSNGRMWLARRGPNVEVCQAFCTRFDGSWQQASHYVLMLMVSIVRLAAGPTWRPAEVRLQTEESSGLRDFATFSAARISFGRPATAIVVPRALLDEPLRPSRDVAMPYPLEAWKASAPGHDFVGSIGQVIETLSWEGYPDVHRTADALGMSVRTLQRHLAGAGLTHQALLGRARFATAATLLAETDTKILDIALDLGYSDHAHFTRAFTRWAGCSPQEFRRRSAANSAAAEVRRSSARA